MPPALTLSRQTSLSSIVPAIGAELLYIGSSWSSMWRVPQEYVTYEFVPTSGSKSLIGDLLLLIFEGGFYRWE